MAESVMDDKADKTKYTSASCEESTPGGAETELCVLGGNSLRLGRHATFVPSNLGPAYSGISPTSSTTIGGDRPPGTSAVSAQSEWPTPPLLPEIKVPTIKLPPAAHHSSTLVCDGESPMGEPPGISSRIEQAVSSSKPRPSPQTPSSSSTSSSSRPATVASREASTSVSEHNGGELLHSPPPTLSTNSVVLPYLAHHTQSTPSSVIVASSFPRPPHLASTHGSYTQQQQSLTQVVSSGHEHRIPSHAPTVAQSSFTQLQTTNDAEAIITKLPPRGSEVEEILEAASDCLRAQDYTQMVQVLSNADENDICIQFGLGVAHHKLRKQAIATRHFMKVIELADAEPHLLEASSALAYYYLGEIESSVGRNLAAASNFYTAMQLHNANAETVASKFRIVVPSVSSLYSKQGSALRQASKLMEAVAAYHNATATAKTDKDKLSTHTSLGNLFQSLGENKRALEQYEQAIELAGKLKDFVSLGWAHGNMGNAFLGLYQKDKAIFYLDKSLELTIKHEPSPQAIGRAYNNLGTAYQSLDDLEKAGEFYDLALSQAIYGRDVPGQARVYGNIGNLFMLQKKYDQAILHYSETLSISNDPSTKSTAYHNRGCARYEQAEMDKKKLYERLNGGNDNHRITFSGQHLEDVDANEKPAFLPTNIKKLYQSACTDLLEVIQHHEEHFQSMKGYSKGLTLSVSLMESNSRTFHRAQDCLYNLERPDTALELAEQSRARSLGELMLERKGRSLPVQFHSPLKMEQIVKIVEMQASDVVCVSYTGARLLVWVLSPINETVVSNMFQVALEDDQFEGKSLDYYLRYSITEILIERNLEMYAPCTYGDASPLSVLHELFAKPLLRVFEAVRGPPHEGRKTVRDVVFIPDSYTSLMPVVALMRSTSTTSQEFLGDHYRFQLMPSLLTLGIMSQLPPPVVEVPEDRERFCVVGNPSIPTFKYQNETWNLGKLPYATEEAEWVAHILKCKATLHEQATKMVVLSKLRGAKVVHLATHGSAAAGFLAFAGLSAGRNKDAVDDKTVLLYPDEVEKLTISPALVVLSSCDSGRGTVKADGIQGMARAFILAGAQAVLTALWRVPDESAAMFMKFFYQFLTDGFRSSEALQKATLSIRFFKKYSGYIHWSGYQLTGRDVEFRVANGNGERLLRSKVGRCGPFPRLEVVSALERAFVMDPHLPTDVQLIQGDHGLKPSEPVIEFITKSHAHFTGGVFWVNGTCSELISAAESHMTQAVGGTRGLMDDRPLLVVFDNISSLPDSEFMMALLKRHNTHIAITLNTSMPPDRIVKEIDRRLLRGTAITQLKPLSERHSTQRIVHSVLHHCHFTPFNREQEIMAVLAEKTFGLPSIVDVSCALLSQCRHECEAVEESDFMEEFVARVLVSDKYAPPPMSSAAPPPFSSSSRPSSASLLAPPSTTEGAGPSSASNHTHDSAGKSHFGIENKDPEVIAFSNKLIEGFSLPPLDYLLLCCLSLFGPVPIPRLVVEAVQTIITSAKVQRKSPSIAATPLANLYNCRLVRVYPSAVITTPSESSCRNASVSEIEPEFYYVPQILCDALMAKMEDVDKAVTVTAAYKALLQIYRSFSGDEVDTSLLQFCAGLARILIWLADNRNYRLLNVNCYQELYRLYVSFKTHGYY